MKTYWWRSPKYRNLGDEITPILLRDLFDIEVERVPLASADFVSAGSSLGWIWSDHYQRRTTPLDVVGSGFMTPDVEICRNPGVAIHSTRGYLSKEILRERLGEAPDLVGDPGLLIGDVISESVLRQKPTPGRVGLIRHHSRVGAEGWEVFARATETVELDIRTDDADSFTREMLSCELIISQSLHGLIFADALGIPNVWFYEGRLHPGGAFKFYDYFSSLGRPMYQLIDEVPGSWREVERSIYEPDLKRVSELRAEIYLAMHRALVKE